MFRRSGQCYRPRVEPTARRRIHRILIRSFPPPNPGNQSQLSFVDSAVAKEVSRVLNGVRSLRATTSLHCWVRSYRISRSTPSAGSDFGRWSKAVTSEHESDGILQQYQVSHGEDFVLCSHPAIAHMAHMVERSMIVRLRLQDDPCYPQIQRSHLQSQTLRSMPD